MNYTCKNLTTLVSGKLCYVHFMNLFSENANIVYLNKDIWCSKFISFENSVRDTVSSYLVPIALQPTIRTVVEKLNQNSFTANTITPN